ncbi:hypothetical protein E4U36_008374 [Claviceps purpurea]|nr:hypothetical protein E4U36_008374 [Claviceps purpurea]
MPLSRIRNHYPSTSTTSSISGYQQQQQQPQRPQTTEIPDPGECRPHLPAVGFQRARTDFRVRPRPDLPPPPPGPRASGAAQKSKKEKVSSAWDRKYELSQASGTRGLGDKKKGFRQI